MAPYLEACGTINKFCKNVKSDLNVDILLESIPVKNFYRLGLYLFKI